LSIAPPLSDIVAPPPEILNAGLNGDLVLFVGAGASMLLGLPSWGGLAAKAMEDLRSAGYLDYSSMEQLLYLDPKKQLSIARLLSIANGHDLKLERHLLGFSEGDSIYKAINDIGCSCITTNYDELLAPRFNASSDGSTTPPQVLRVYKREELLAKHLNRPGTVVHLHGAVSDPKTMIVSTKDYLEHYDHPKVQEFLDELFHKKVVLFLGYGLEEAEILEHILRRGRVSSSRERRRFALQGFFRSQAPLYDNLHRYYETSFGVHLLGFERDRENFRCLERILKSWVSTIEVRKPPLATDVEFMEEVLGDG
jgi:hypothetical protein